nr:winged helix DNA-binding domain-containing protein [Saccharopolyspora sp. ASAGF58]
MALKAYFETRSRYLGSLPPRQAFNQIGEVLPTIIWDGQVIGTWSWQGATKTVAYTLARRRTTPQQRKAVADHATLLSGALRLGWSSTLHTPAEDQLALL